MVDTMTRLFRDSDALLQQVSHILDVLRLLLQESALDHILQSVVVRFVGRLAQADEVFQEGLLDLECFVDRLDGVDWVVGPGDLGGWNVRRLRDAAPLDEVALEPLAVGEALSGGPLPEPESVSVIRTLLVLR